ncbi:ABC transporter substrate-binding protein [Corynebacterium phocae]|uniref:ABC transporter substrate-binding protein n=1 Tax=Corynebacterium phocae TaxID=161895 RepID=A0A1L7D1F5_9CORY|nr:ABC transporter substrate-binding protein [Corynebacterium phocae]APT91975.1 ABC transporter substrate-binding protein [Corynebacterium phocae]KAA8726969.1 ABC transporter substrate-binding protein [Corynebacterium phocae]
MKKLALLGALLLTACGTSPEAPSAYSVDNCGHTFDFERAPERVVLQDVSPVLTLSELGVLDKVVAKAGFYPEEYFSPELNSQVESIKTLSDRLDATGHLQISKEAIVAERPDLVIGYSDAYSPDTVTDTPVVMDPGFCGEVKEASWSHVDDEIDLYAQIFQAEEAAQALKDDVAAQVKALDSSAGAGRTVAVLYPGTEGGTLYAYGKDSMSNPIVTSLGLKNVFGDTAERVFEISAEQLVAKNPDVILILNSGEDRVVESVTSLPGAQTITAVQKKAILPMLLTFAEPPSPMAVKGAQKLEQFLHDTH